MCKAVRVYATNHVSILHFARDTSAKNDTRRSALPFAQVAANAMEHSPSILGFKTDSSSWRAEFRFEAQFSFDSW